MKKIDVLFRGWGQAWVLGTLADNGADLLFEYSPETLARDIEFSPLHLPLRAAAFSGFPEHLGRLPGLVSDSLPDGWGLLLMDQLFLKSGRDPHRVSPLDRLSFIGERAMGALAFRPSDDLSASSDDMSLLELARASHEIIEDKDTAALKALALVGGSPHGARPKALVRLDENTATVSTREDVAGGFWLVKFPARAEHKEVCAIEHAYAGLARSCGIEVPPTRHFEIDKHLAAFGVERFDRVGAMRVPVHSFAGALHANFRLPALDYQTLLRATRLFTRDEAEVAKAFARCVFNVVFNNRDDHAKNFSLRMDERMAWKLSPAYDLSFNAGPRGWHQTSVMGEALAPGRADLLRLAQDCGVPAAIAAQTMDRICTEADGLAARLQAFEIRKATCKTIADAVARNVQRCKAGPEGGAAARRRSPR
ncbi:MAG TPA: type II toxin-antitoxin system HipA family toxin [Ideonella sp.]|nr:type II toxin-antitoxin system HipA family toxin [Ideonella sp.]